MVLQHIENLNAVSVVRGTPLHNRVAVATHVLIPEKEVLCIDTSTFPSSCYASCPVGLSEVVNIPVISVLIIARYTCVLGSHMKKEWCSVQLLKAN